MITNYFPYTTSANNSVVWTVHGTIISYGNNEKSELKLYVHNGTELGSWIPLLEHSISYNAIDGNVRL